MHAVRHLLAQRHLAVLICTATLLLKLLIPAGYMIDKDHGRMTITVCSGTGPVTISMEMPGMHGDMSNHGQKDHGKVEMPCAFSGLSAAMLGLIDPVQLAALIAFVLTVGMRPVVPPAPIRRTHVLPPLRGPPAYL